ncbi:MAG: transglycosylase domain-containing protein [Patescibacteria group bacterium]|nr:transglycosylase domain-containing protein [Patescibacteria group bacterium]
MKKKIILILIAVLALAFVGTSFFMSADVSHDLVRIYEAQFSRIFYDRNGEIIRIEPNKTGYLSQKLDTVPADFAELLLEKEDKYFYMHFGVNPVSVGRAIFRMFIGNSRIASSTITQQLTKILLGHEQNRSWENKLQETLYAIALEMNLSKEEILQMYLNSIYFGNKISGLNLASQFYFGVTLEMLNKAQILQLLATISSPSRTNPFLKNNSNVVKNLSDRLEISSRSQVELTEKEILFQKETFNQVVSKDSYFEMQSLGLDCPATCKLTVDEDLTVKIREIMQRNIWARLGEKAENGAVVVIKLPENELLASLGTPDPSADFNGYQIDMTRQPRAIGSTVKPFIYANGFESGLRPYTLIEDKEYRYETGHGFSFYPKNYDYKYHGLVNLHYALSNSLNVPTVKVLEFVGLDKFYGFLTDVLEFKPSQKLTDYQFGIALGQLEMDLLHLTYYFTIFPNQGHLYPLKISEGQEIFGLDKKVFDKSQAQLINKILLDRVTASDQFGLRSDLNFPKAVAIKTGTSREFHDSWAIGYTPDFLVGVWIGNARNEAMSGVSGQSGAGAILHEVVNLLLNSKYNKNTLWQFDLLEEYNDNGQIEFGLSGDDFTEAKNVLLEENQSLILSPHDGDVFLLDDDTQIFLKASSEVEWFADGISVGSGADISWRPEESGSLEIEARGVAGSESVRVEVE